MSGSRCPSREASQELAAKTQEVIPVECRQNPAAAATVPEVDGMPLGCERSGSEAAESVAWIRGHSCKEAGGTGRVPALSVAGATAGPVPRSCRSEITDAEAGPAEVVAAASALAFAGLPAEC